MFSNNAKIPTPEEFARSVLDNRAMVVAEAAKLRAEGNEREAKAWDRQLPKWDKLIANYGLKRFARP